ncbi:MAG: hypothetical protein ACXWLZ_00900 [Rhizomicrobium sp.]
MIWSLIQIFFAGLWDEIWQYGIGVVLIILLLAAAWFSPIFKKKFLWGAAGVGAVMIAFTIGVGTGEKRVHAQWDASRAATLTEVKKARTRAVRDVARKPSRWVRASKDPDQRD